MATRQAIKKLIARFDAQGKIVSLDSVGAVVAVNRIERGEQLDVVVLTAAALMRLAELGVIRGDSIRPFALSETMIATPKSIYQRPIHSREQLVDALRNAPAIGYSTGASGKAILAMFEQWGVLDELKPRMVQAPPGVSVGTLLASGKATIGFQQHSELLHYDGIRVVSGMPKGDEIISTFSAAICTTATDVEGAKEFIEFLTGPLAIESLREEGLDSVHGVSAVR